MPPSPRNLQAMFTVRGIILHIDVKQLLPREAHQIPEYFLNNLSLCFYMCFLEANYCILYGFVPYAYVFHDNNIFLMPQKCFISSSYS